MIGFKHFRKIAAHPREKLIINQFEEEKQLSRFLKYLDGSITEITAQDLANVPISGTTGRNMNECLCGLSNLRKVELPDHYTDIPDASFLLFGNSNGENIEILFPATIISISNGAFDMFLGTDVTLNFTKAQQVPTVVNTQDNSSFSKATEVLVPASLYENWKNTAGWNQLADKIRAV